MNISLDRIDRKILTELQQDCTLSIAALADRVGLSTTPCWRRVARIEAAGMIRGRVAILNPDALGLGVSVFAEVRIARHDEETLDAFERGVCERAEVVECHSMSGERDYLLHIVVADVASYERFLKKVLLHLPGVAAINSSFALKPVKQTTRLPIDAT